MKLAIKMVVGAAIALAAPLAPGADAYAPYGEDYTGGEPIPPETLEKIEHAKPLLSPKRNPSPAAGSGQRALRRSAEGTAASPPQTMQGSPLPRTGL